MFRRFTPRASISFKPAPDHLLYASYSEGFKGGGFDPRGSGIAAPDLNGNGVSGAGGDYADVYDFLSFDPESVTTYEISWRRPCSAAGSPTRSKASGRITRTAIFPARTAMITMATGFKKR